MESQNPALACNLTDAEFRLRRTEILNSFRGAVLETAELENGYRYRFPSSPKWIIQLAEFITFERACCPFLQFDLRLEPGDGPISLELTGPEGTKDFLLSLFPATV